MTLFSAFFEYRIIKMRKIEIIQNLNTFCIKFFYQKVHILKDFT